MVDKYNQSKNGKGDAIATTREAISYNLRGVELADQTQVGK